MIVNEIQTNSIQTNTKYIICYLNTANFEFVSEKNLHSMCMPSTPKVLTVSDSAESKALHYIISPNFQLPYTQNINFRKTDCWMNITAPRGVGIRLVSQYMDIRPGNFSF